jgi:hypothetical protein
MTIKFDIDYNDLVAYYRYFAKTSKNMIFGKWLRVLIVPALMLINLLSSSSSEYDKKFGLFVLLVHVLISAVWVIIILVIEHSRPARIVRKQITNPENIGIIGYREMTFTDDGIIAKSEKSETKMSWDAIVKVTETGTYFLPYIGANQAFIIPKQKITPQDVETLESLFKAHNLLINKTKN